jgi:hypothetical protein
MCKSRVGVRLDKLQIVRVTLFVDDAISKRWLSTANFHPERGDISLGLRIIHNEGV